MTVDGDNMDSNTPMKKLSNEKPELSLGHRFLRALLLTTVLYSSLLFCYVMIRIVVNDAPLNSPFIDYLLPWFTFIRLAAITFATVILSVTACLTLFLMEREGVRGYDERNA